MTIEFDTIYTGDALEVLRGLPDGSVNCCVTSPPYYALRDYGMDGQIGRESSPKEYVSRLTEVFAEVRRVLRPDGTLWLNLGDTYAGRGAEEIKPKDLIGIPWMAAFALRDDGWYLRNDIIWMKENPMPENERGGGGRGHVHIFLFSKSKLYFIDYMAISEPVTESTKERLKRGIAGSNKYGAPIPGQPKVQTINLPRGHGTISDGDIYPLRSKRDVWIVNTVPFKGGHYAAYPPKLVESCILAGCPVGGVVLDPFMGSGTTGMVAKQHDRHYVGIEINPEFAALAEARSGGDL